MNIYLDIDGVLIHDSLSQNGLPVNHALEFLKFATSKHTCFWLSTHCHDGENHAPEFILERLPESKIYLDKIIPTDWGTWKTDAIDFNQDFRWIDDDVYEEELNVLSKHGCSEKLVVINLQENPNQLKELITAL